MMQRDNELARRFEGRVQIRTTPLRLRWTFDRLVASDGHELRAQFSCSVVPLAQPTERRMLEEVLLSGRASASDDDVAAHFRPALQAAVAQAALHHAGAEWLAEAASSELRETLHKAAVRVAFDCGVEVLPPFTLEIDSPTYRQQLMSARQQAINDQRAAGQLEQIQHAGAMLKEFEALRKSSPDLSPGRILEQLNTDDRGEILRTTFLAAANGRGNAPLWVVAGQSLLRFDIAGGRNRSQTTELPLTFGPFRSVEADATDSAFLLIGARGGVIRVDPQSPSSAQFYSAGNVTSQLGFNRVIHWPTRGGVVASHSELGIIFWKLGETEALAKRVGDAAKNVQILDDERLIFTAGNRLLTTDLTEVTSLPTISAADIVAILTDDRGILVIHEDATICRLDPATMKNECITRRAQNISSAAMLPWLGSSRLLLTTEDGSLECIGLDDSLVTQYQSPHRGLRAVCATGGLVAALSGDRQRLIFWNTWDGRQPIDEIFLSSLTRHRAAGINFG
jgi:hypothetical protein